MDLNGYVRLLEPKLKGLGTAGPLQAFTFCRPLAKQAQYIDEMDLNGYFSLVPAHKDVQTKAVVTAGRHDQHTKRSPPLGTQSGCHRYNA